MSTRKRAVFASFVALFVGSSISVAVGACYHDWDLLEVQEMTNAGAGGGGGGSAPVDAGSDASSDAPCSDDLSIDPANCGTCGNACESGQCAASQCVPTMDADAGPCSLDLQTDEANCGTCGHDCQGGQCAGGACQPVVLANDQGSPTGITIDSTTIYWTDYSGGEIRSMPLNGGMVKTLASGQQKPAHIQVQDQYLYWANGGSAASNGTIVRSQLSGQLATPIITNITNTVGIHVTPTSIYYTSQQTPNGAVYKAPIGGGAMPTQLASGLDFPEDVILDGNRLFVAELYGAQVSIVPEGGGMHTPFFNQSGDPAGVAVDGTALYFTTQVGDTVYAVDKTTPANLVVVASNQNGATGIAVSATTVYWANFYDGTIMKMAKPALPF